MNRDEIKRMARESGLEVMADTYGLWTDLERFAALAAAAEREACAKIAESVNNHDNPMTAQDVADAIRSRQ